MIILFIFILILLIIFLHKKKCTEYKYILGKRIDGIKIAGKLSFPTVNIETNVNINCGFYRGNTKYGNVTVIVGNNNNRADIHFDNFNYNIDSLKFIELYNLKKIYNKKSDILSTYYNGCKN